MNRTANMALAGIAASMLAACASAPLSFIDASRRNPLPEDHYPVRIVSVDGSLQFDDAVQVEPGPRWIVAQALDGKSARGSEQKSFAFKVAPCTRYFFGAARTSRLSADWQLVVEGKEPVAGCNPEEEAKKSDKKPESATKAS